MPKRPNILHLFTDMQRFDTIAALGNPVIRTPNLDRLCEEGVAFTSAYTPSPVCVAARCSMIYGQYPMHTKCYENSRMPTDERETFMDALARAGYRTHGIGKCHFTPDRHALRGFHAREVQEEGGAGSMDELARADYLRYLHEKGYAHICEPFGVRGEMYYMPQPSQLPAADHPTTWVGDRSIAFIQDRKTKDDPWYLFSSFIHPHPPFTPPNPWHKLYRPALMPLPIVPEDHESLLTYVNRVQNRYKYRDQGFDRNVVRTMIAYYYACISFIDYQVGRIVDVLEQTGQLDNTLILFSSDHGEFLGQNRCYGKRSMHDASSRVPLVARLPGRFEGGKRCDHPVSLVDIAPTFLAAAGTAVESHDPDGVDLREVLTEVTDRKFVFSQLSLASNGMNAMAQGHRYEPVEDQEAPEHIAAYSSYMCVSREWKYFYSAPDDREYFFDRAADPNETRNRAGVSFVEPHLSRHKSALLEHLTRGGETAGIDRGAWRKFPTREVSPNPDTGLLIQDYYTPWAEMELPDGYGDR